MWGLGQPNIFWCLQHRSSSASLFDWPQGYILQGYLGWWGRPGGVRPVALNTNLSPFPTNSSVTAFCLLARGQGTLCVVCHDWVTPCPRDGRVQLHQLIFSGSMTHLNQLASAWSSATRLSSYCAWVHLLQVCSLLPSDTDRKLRHAVTRGLDGHLSPQDSCIGSCGHRGHRGCFLLGGHHDRSSLRAYSNGCLNWPCEAALLCTSWTDTPWSLGLPVEVQR